MTNMAKALDSFADERDFALLQNDRYTFCVLSRIMKGEHELFLTDHEKLILFFTSQPYPVWIWMPDDAAMEEKERAFVLSKENGLIDGKHNFNLKYDLAEYFMKRAKEEGVELTIKTNLFAYDCPDPIEPSFKSDGAMYSATMDDFETLVEFMDMFHKETNVDQQGIEAYREHAKGCIESGRLHFWKDAQGNCVASCNYAPNEDMASINLVFTHPDFRRKHYAENLVYEVTMLVKNEGYMPMLYTDADYVASNACYEKIGYKLKGKLCTIG